MIVKELEAEGEVSKFELKDGDVAIIIHPQSGVSLVVPAPKDGNPLETLPINALVAVGMMTNMRDMDFVMAMIAAGTEYIQKRNAEQGKPAGEFVLVMEDNTSRKLKLSPQQVEYLVELGHIYMCGSPNHAGCFHFSDEFMTKYDTEVAAWDALTKIVENMVN